MIQATEQRSCKFGCNTSLVFDGSSQFGIELHTKMLHNWARCSDVMKSQGITPPPWFITRIKQYNNSDAVKEAMQMGRELKNNIVLYTNGYLVFAISKGMKIEVGKFDEENIIKINENMKPILRSYVLTDEYLERKKRDELWGFDSDSNNTT